MKKLYNISKLYTCDSYNGRNRTKDVNDRASEERLSKLFRNKGGETRIENFDFISLALITRNISFQFLFYKSNNVRAPFFYLFIFLSLKKHSTFSRTY